MPTWWLASSTELVMHPHERERLESAADDDVPMTTEDLASYLWQRHRIRRSRRTLQLYRREGGGPPFFRCGNKVFHMPASPMRGQLSAGAIR
jgi:hypothetical protein